MKVDVLIEYNPKLPEISFSSTAARITETRTAWIGLSRPKHTDTGLEQIEFVGEDWETIKEIEAAFPAEPTRKDYVLRIINPFDSSTFEPLYAFRTAAFFILIIRYKLYPKTALLRKLIPLFDRYEITLKIPAYNLYNPQKKAEFEKLLRKEYKHTTFVS